MPARRLASALFLAVLLSPFAVPTLAAETTSETRPVFGPYEAIIYDRETLQGVRTDDQGNVWIMFQPARRGTQLVLRISMQPGAPYREWFTGDIDLVAQENVGREPNSWTDRVQTTANYIEYRDGERIFLHLRKTKT